MWNNSANLVAKMNRIFLVRMTLKKLSYWTLNLREWQISNYWMPIHALKILCQTFSTFVFFNKYLVMHIEWYCAFLLEIQIGRSLGCVQYTLCSLRCFNFVQFTVMFVGFKFTKNAWTPVWSAKNTWFRRYSFNYRASQRGTSSITTGVSSKTSLCRKGLRFCLLV